MTQAEIQKELLQQLQALPEEAAREVLNFAQFLARKAGTKSKEDTSLPNDPPRERPLGLLKDRASFKMTPDFAISDEELLGS